MEPELPVPLELPAPAVAPEPLPPELNEVPAAPLAPVVEEPALPPELEPPAELGGESVLLPLHATPFATKTAIAIEPRQAIREVMTLAMAYRNHGAVFENAPGG